MSSQSPHWRLIILLSSVLAGCASYATPGKGYNLQKLSRESPPAQALLDQTDFNVQSELEKLPLASFPTAVAMVRIQAPGYRSYTTRSYGSGAYSVITTRDVEKDEYIDRLSKLPMLHGLIPISRLLLPQHLNSDLELRQAAAQLHADMLLIYTLDTEFYSEDKAAPLTVISLGLSPNMQARVLCTASAVLMDTRNGYIYGAAEGTDAQKQTANAWTNANAIDETRRRAESEAFRKLVGQVEVMWARVLKEQVPVANGG